MKITKLLTRPTSRNTFFRYSEDSICIESVEKLAGIKITDQLIARVTVASKNPKKKGFTKVSWRGEVFVKIKGEEFPTLSKHERFLKTLDIQVDQSFWMKAEIA